MKNLISCIWKEVPIISIEEKMIINVLLGIVAKKSEDDESWAAYCGIVSSNGSELDRERKDIEKIMKHGSKLSKNEAIKWFPDITLKYRD